MLENGGINFKDPTPAAPGDANNATGECVQWCTSTHSVHKGPT